MTPEIGDVPSRTPYRREDIRQNELSSSRPQVKKLKISIKIRIKIVY
jgi:hypothetical protein